MLEYLKIINVIISSHFSEFNLDVMRPGFLMALLSSVAISLYGFSLGKTKTALSLFSVYIAFVLEKAFPYGALPTNMSYQQIEHHWLRIGLFFLFLIIVFIILNFSFIIKKIGSTEFRFIPVILIVLVQIGFFISIIFSMLPKELTAQYLPFLSTYFATDIALFFWASIPLPIFLFLRTR